MDGTIPSMLIFLAVVFIIVGLLVALLWPDPRAHNLGYALLVIGVILLVVWALLASDLNIGDGHNDLAVGPALWVLWQRFRRTV